MERSRKLVLINWTQANDALILYFEGNKSKLAKQTKMSRTTVTNFFGAKPVRESEFRDICFALRLNWQAMSRAAAITSSSTLSEPNDALIQQVREHCRQKILNQYSRMRLLSGVEIGVDQLYVDVYLLNRSPRTFQVSPSKLLETFDLRNDRLGLGDRIRRNSGFEVANANPKLMILGKPGAGKTTFLRHLAVDWCKGEFQPNLIVVLIELRQIRDGQWNLLDAIGKKLGLEERQQVETFLKQGRLLVLMDGLDEVPTDQLRRDVQKQLQQMAEDYPNNRLILTCRTQIIESIPDGFTSVEVADFNEEQVQQFVYKWFAAGVQSSAEVEQQYQTFSAAVNHNSALKELTVTPVLLSLMCLVLQDEGEIPRQRNELYERGIKLLLSKWNDAKQIDGWEVGSETYRQLSIEQKVALLTEIAAHKFENPENFVLFQQQEIVHFIDEFLRCLNLNRKIAKFLGRVDSRESIAVLKAIEAQHGLLIERADELWSFSHLTFQEYFTIQWLTQLPAEQLAEKIASDGWQEAVKQIVKSQQPADRLLRMIKQAIDQSIANEPKLQEFLTWVLQKSESVSANYKPVAIRAFYFALDLNHTLALDLDLNGARTYARIRALNLDLNLNLNLNYDRDHDRASAFFNFVRPLAYNFNFDLNLARARALDLAFYLDRALHAEIASKLEQLKVKLPEIYSENWKSLQQWLYGIQWIEQLRQVMIEHRNIGHDWQFTERQLQQLQRYYDVNKFLVELMNIKGAVSNTVRAEIEDSLLVPWSELQRRQS